MSDGKQDQRPEWELAKDRVLAKYSGAWCRNIAGGLRIEAIYLGQNYVLSSPWSDQTIAWMDADEQIQPPSPGNQENRSKAVTEGEERCGCQELPVGWICTLPKGHDGDHKAGNGEGRFYSSWPSISEPIDPSLFRDAVEALREVDATLCECRREHGVRSANCNCDVHASHRVIRKFLARYDALSAPKGDSHE